MKRSNLIGRRLGRLSVIDFAGVDKWGQSKWLCECECGNKTIVTARNLTDGRTTSCGCRKYDRFTDDLTGRRYGRLTVLAFDHMGARGHSYWLCECDCGAELVVRRDGLISGHTTSCGCYAKDVTIARLTTHGLYEHPLYTIWRGMRSRCRNESYSRYAGRGITVCDEWEDFENFYQWAINNGYQRGLSIDRIDNDGNYCPENCRWADDATQANNKYTCRYITYNGITHTIAEWSRLFGVHYETLRHRIGRQDMRDFKTYFGEKE